MTENMRSSELRLPHKIRQSASLRGNEYAWPIEDIPKVIEAARQANLASIGGQLQFRLTDEGTCECYLVEVDTYKSVPTSLPWPERVEQTATVALADFSRLLSKFHLVAEGRRSFPEHFKHLEAEGGDLAQTMCFVWYLDDGSLLPRHLNHSPTAKRSDHCYRSWPTMTMRKFNLLPDLSSLNLHPADN